ncbi:MAG: polyprenyl synthetase family protein [Mailhella sp.]|nr:polyprenyl synthetase family protein [Mailhella sp.]
MNNGLLTRINEFLAETFLSSDIPGQLSEAMRYSLLAGGKRLRPMLFLSMARACAPERAEELTTRLMPFAAGLEMIHTYSLIHDDLPAMDNDDLRRGRPTCHKAYGEANAILAGDALLTNAFGYMTQAEAAADLLLKAIRLSAEAAGAAGMAGGQVLDLAAEGRAITLEALKILNAKKTGALLRCSCECGALLAGASERQMEAARIFGSELGIAFQITDDILDVVGEESAVGKQVRHDAECGKATWPSLLGLDAARQKAELCCKRAEMALDGILYGQDAEFLCQTARRLVGRTH